MSNGVAAGVGADSIAPPDSKPSGTYPLAEMLVCTCLVRRLGAVVGKKPVASGLSGVDSVGGGWWKGGYCNW